MNVVASVSVIVDIGRSLREGLFMFWETLWALVLGFTLSGVVQSFVSKNQMREKLGDHRPAAVGRAAGYGMMSSSCSYAASAMSKSLFAKGADFVSAMVFLIASTNLVIELGVVLLVLLGWQFMAAEFVGGPIMIVLLAALGGFVFRTALVEPARRRARGEHGDRLDHGPEHEPEHGPEHEPEHEHEHEHEQGQEDEASALTSKMRSPAAWSDAASYAVSDATMLRRELMIGYAVAGFLAVLIPARVWNVLFIHGHGFWTTLENALVGPLVAILSWVCSIGNVPLAAALWSGGISFGGVISFVFADLITMPLILIYRKFYGPKLTRRIVALFYVLMVAAGLATEEIFRLFHGIPTTRSFRAGSAHFSLDYTSYLNFVFIVLAVAVYWLSKNKERFGGGEGYAIDPVCAMQVRIADAPATACVDGTTHYFCSDRCRDRFLAGGQGEGARPLSAATAVDPVCGMTVDTAHAAAIREQDGTTYYFCNPGCAQSFEANPDEYLRRPERPTPEAALSARRHPTPP